MARKRGLEEAPGVTFPQQLGVLHDFRNTLAVIQVNTELLAQHLREHSPDDATAAELLAGIALAAGSAHQITQRILTTARREPPAQAAAVGLREIIDDVIVMVRQRLDGDSPVRIDVVVDPHLRVRARRADLQHALLNLVLNARDAMPAGGRIEISARPLALEHGDAARRDVAPGRYVELAVADSGTGMDEATRARALEPFFTTKPAHQGTGLGLSAVHDCVRAHGGGIEVASHPGEGTCVHLLLPDGSL
jgi:signal transduction histidine kinase